MQLFFCLGSVQRTLGSHGPCFIHKHLFWETETGTNTGKQSFIILPHYSNYFTHFTVWTRKNMADQIFPIFWFCWVLRVFLVLAPVIWSPRKKSEAPRKGQNVRESTWKYPVRIHQTSASLPASSSLMDIAWRLMWKTKTVVRAGSVWSLVREVIAKQIFVGTLCTPHYYQP